MKRTPAAGRVPSRLTLRLSADVLAKLRAFRPGWQTRIEETIRRELGM
jgi:uncharacterized protein (DUF4415 family)